MSGLICFKQLLTTLVYPVWFYLAVLCSGCLFSLAENTVMILTTVADSPWQTPSKICLLFEVTRCLFTMVVFSRALLVRVLQQEWSGAMQQLPSAHLQWWEGSHWVHGMPTRQGHPGTRKWQQGWLLRLGIKCSQPLFESIPTSVFYFSCLCSLLVSSGLP